MRQKISPNLKQRAIGWIQGVQEEIRQRNLKRALKSQYGVAVKRYESVCVAQLQAGDAIKLRLSNKSSNEKSRLWTIFKIVPMGITAHLWLKCPTTDFEANVVLRLDHRVLKGVSR